MSFVDMRTFSAIPLRTNIKEPTSKVEHADAGKHFTLLDTSFTGGTSQHFNNVLDKNYKTIKMVDKKNQYDLWWKLAKKFIGREQRQLSKTRLWDIRNLHTHVSVLSVGRCSCADSWGAGGGTMVPQSGFWHKTLYFLLSNFYISVVS